MIMRIKSDTNTTITATKIESKREIYYGNHTLLFASTEAGGFFLVVMMMVMPY